MFSSLLSRFSRHLRVIAAGSAVVAATGAATTVFADDAAKSPYTVSIGNDFTSHFISYGVDVWGGGDEISPFSPRSTEFAYATVSAAITSNISVFVNVWSDNNNNTNSNLGGSIQEIDFNTGVNFTLDKLSIGIAPGFWNYAGDTEKIVDLNVGYNDTDMFMKGFAFSPGVTFHYRYDGNNGQDTGLAVVPGIKPSWTFFGDSKYPLTVALPINAGFFSNGFQGGHGAYGFVSGGLAGTVPLAFIPSNYGSWSATASVIYYNTSAKAIPSNPEDNFFVSTITIGVTF